MTKESLDTLKSIIKKIRLIALSLYLMGTVTTVVLSLLKIDTLAGVIVLLCAVSCHVVSEVINKEYTEKLNKEINKNNRKIQL